MFLRGLLLVADIGVVPVATDVRVRRWETVRESLTVAGRGFWHWIEIVDDSTEAGPAEPTNRNCSLVKKSL